MVLLQIYRSLLFDFRIWSRSEFHVQIGHVQYLSTIIKDDRKFFRRKFGVQFFLDVIRRHYSPSIATEDSGGGQLCKEDCRTIRASLRGLVKFFLQRDATARDVNPIVAFLLTEKNEILLREMGETVVQYLENGRQTRDQVFLLMYEKKRADLLYCQLLAKEFSPSLRRSLLRLLTVLLRTSRVSLRHKYRMHLAEARYLGFLHLWFRKSAKGEITAITKEEILLLLDQMLLFDQPVSYQGVLGLVHHLQWSDVSTKLEAARRIMTCLFAKPEVPQNFAKQIGWQECLAKLLVKKMLKPDLGAADVSIDESVEEAEDSFSPTHLISTAKQYLPQPAGDALELVGSTVGAVVSGTQKRVTGVVGGYVSSTVQATHDAVASRTNQILDKLEDLGGRRRRNSAGSTHSEQLLMPQQQQSSAEPTPHYYLQAYDQFGFEDLTLEAGSMNKSPSWSSEDVSVSRAEDDATSTDDIPDLEMVNAELAASEASRAVLGNSSKVNGEEEELCQLVMNILFTVMWRGLRGATADVIRERGQVSEEKIRSCCT